jgi:hypothetical protein
LSASPTWQDSVLQSSVKSLQHRKIIEPLDYILRFPYRNHSVRCFPDFLCSFVQNHLSGLSVAEHQDGIFGVYIATAEFFPFVPSHETETFSKTAAICAF